MEELKYKLSFYETENGNTPVLDFISELKEKAIKNELSKKLLNKLDLRIRSLRKNGTLEGMPHFEPLSNLKYPLSQLRIAHNTNEYRIIICPWISNDNEHYFVLLHWFQKKTKKTPDRDKKLAESRMKQFLLRKGGRIK